MGISVGVNVDDVSRIWLCGLGCTGLVGLVELMIYL